MSERATSTLRVFNAADLFSGTVNAIPGTAPGVQPIRTGSTPQEVAVSPNGRIGFVANFNSGYISVVDLVIGNEIRRIPGILARSVALNASGSLLVATVAADQLKVIDTQNFDVSTVTLPDGTNPQQVVVSGNRAYINARGFAAPKPVVVVDLSSYPSLSASTVTGTTFGFGPPKGGAMTTPDGRVLMLRGGTPYKLLVIEPAAGDAVRELKLPFVTYAVASSDSRTFLLHKDGGGHAAGIAQINPAQPAGDAMVLANTPVSFNITPATPFASDGSFQMALSGDGSRLVTVAAAYAISPKVTTWDVSQLLVTPGDAVPVKRFDLQHMIRDVRFVPATANEFPVPQPVITSVCAPATATVACPKTIANDAPTTLTINGNNFAPGALVRVGNSLPLPASVSSSSRMSVTVPAGLAAQNARIIVTQPGSSVADQHVSGALPVFDQFDKPIVITSPANFQPNQQVLVANFGDSTLSILNSATNQSVSDPLWGPWVQPMSIAVEPNSNYAVVLSFAPALIHRRSLLQWEDLRTFSTLAVNSGQTGALAVRPDNGVFGGLAAMAWTMHNDGTANAPMLSTHQSGNASAFQRLRVVAPSPAQAVLALGVDPQGQFAYGASLIGPPGNAVGYLHLLPLAPPTALNPINVTPTSIACTTLGLADAQYNLHFSPDGNTLAAAASDGAIQLLDVTVRTNPVAGVKLPGDPGALTTSLSGTISFADFQIVDVPGVGRRVYGWDPDNRLLQVFDPAAPSAALGAVQVPGTNSFVTQMVVTPDGRLAYAALADEDAVAVIDLSRVNRTGSVGAVVTKVRTGLSPLSLALRPATPVEIGTTSVDLTADPLKGVPNGTANMIGSVTVSFPGGVTSPGTLTVTTTNRTPNPVPAGFSLGDIPLFFEITAGDGLAFNGTATLCLPYDPTKWVGSMLVIKHFVGGVWVDQPTTVNYTTGQVCASVTSFSPFVYGTYDTTYLLDSLAAAIDALTGNQGLINSLRVKAENALSAMAEGELAEVRDTLTALRNQIRAQADKKLLTAQQASDLIGQIELILANL